MKYEYDEIKRHSNKVKHGLDFALMENFDWDFALYSDPHHDPVTGEARDLVIGPISVDLVAVVICQRTEATRIISLRLATNHEIKLWKDEYYE